MITENTATPTAEEIDILQRWVEFIKATENYWDPTQFGTKTSVGKIFGIQATMRTVFCLGNAYADIQAVIPDADEEVAQVRVLVMFNPHQNFQVFVGYDFADREEIKVPLDNVSAHFQPYQVTSFLEYMKQVFA